MSRQTGFALLLVLWLLSLLSLMAGSFIISVRRETAMVSALKTQAELRAIVASGVDLAVWMLLHSNPDQRWRADGSIYEIQLTDATLRLQLVAEAGKININLADEALLKRLFYQTGQGIETQINGITINKVAALLDWRDSDDLVHLQGAESALYQQLGLSYVPPNQLLQSVKELSLVLGMDEPTVNWLEPLVTINSTQTEPDLTLAPEAVLRLYIKDKTVLTAYLKQRYDSARLNLPTPPLPLSEIKTTTSELDTVSIIAELKNTEQHSATVPALVRLTATNNKPFSVLSWQNQTTGLSLFSDNMNALVVKHYESELDH